MKKLWFVQSVYHPAGLRRMNDILMKVVKDEFLHHIVSDDNLAILTARLRTVQDETLAENRRLKPETIALYDEDKRFSPGSLTLAVGDGRVTLRKVEGEIH